MERKSSAERLKELMEYFGIKQNDLSNRTGIPKSAISMYVNGDRIPTNTRFWANLLAENQYSCPRKERIMLCLERILKLIFA